MSNNFKMFKNRSGIMCDTQERRKKEIDVNLLYF